MAEPQVPDLLLKLKGASKALSLTAAWKELKYLPCFRESCFLQRVRSSHIQNTQNPAGHGHGQPVVADPAGASCGTGRSPEVSSSLSTLWCYEKSLCLSAVLFTAAE